MQPLPLSTDGQQLSNNLQAAASDYMQPSDDKVHVAGVAAGLYAAYERLRNAAEYTEQHLLLRAAIERFLRRNILFRASKPEFGQELIVELTEAGYLKNDTVPTVMIGHINQFIGQYAQLARLIETEHRVPHEKARKWTVQVLSVSIEKLLAPHLITDAFIDFAFKHFQATVDRAAFGESDSTLFDNALYVAVHHALFKSDIATVRFYMMVRMRDQAQSPEHFIAVCKDVDRLFQDPLANRLSRLVSRNGAPMRILRELIISEVTPGATVTNRPSLLAKVRAVTDQQYDLVHARLAKGVMRAIVFVFITKVIIGLSVEVPYDLVTVGSISIMPLIINLLFPSLYMATARWSITKPGDRNTEAIVQHIDRMLYQVDRPPIQYRAQRRVDSSALRSSFNIVYGLTFLISFGLVLYLLSKLHFTVVQGAIFFIFFSAVSFLRFRLIQSARELEFVDHRQSLLSTVADFFYTPFVRLGMWLSDKYKQVNIITILLDFAIELPLKTSLRLLRQWASFMRDKREEI